jgi:hypothetical protein
MKRRVPAEVALDGQSEGGPDAQPGPSGAKKAHGEEEPQGYELRLDLVQAAEMAEPIGTEGEEESGDTASRP